MSSIRESWHTFCHALGAGAMLWPSLDVPVCLVRHLFVISTSVNEGLGRFVSEMTYHVSTWTLNLAQLNSNVPILLNVFAVLLLSLLFYYHLLG